MIGRIVTGKSFRGAVEYVMNKPGAKLLECDGVNASDARSITHSFNFQRRARPEKADVVGYISLSFHSADAPKLTDGLMRKLAGEYMERMDITGTQYITVRHNDTEHPHLHIVYNRVRYDAKLVRKHNERIRNAAVCKALKLQYGLTFSEGKRHVKTEKLHGADKVKYAVYTAVVEALPRCLSPESLADELKEYGINARFVHRSGDPSKEVQGLTFTKDGVTFKASQIDRNFSYGNLCKIIENNRAEAAERQADEQQRRIKELRGHKLTPEQQDELYSQEGLVISYRERDCEYISRFRVFRPEEGTDIPTETILSQNVVNINPVVFGVRLSDGQVRRIKDGQYVYLENMRRGGKTFSGYLIMNDRLTKSWIFREKPDRWIKYGEYEMRVMDKLLIDSGFVARAVVKWWGGYGQTARPYLWKEKPGDTAYRQSWDDPRNPRPKETLSPTETMLTVQRKKRGRGV